MKQVITLSDNAANRIKEIMSKAEKDLVSSLDIISLILFAALSLRVITCFIINLTPT